MSRTWREAARASGRFQAKPRRPWLVRALLTRQPIAKRRARSPERRWAPAHGWTAGTLSGSEIVGVAGNATGSGVWADAMPGTANSIAVAAPTAARVQVVPLAAATRIA